jgi:hypothetical protein
MPTARVRPSISDERRRTRPHIDAWVPIAVLAALAAIVLLRPVLEPGPYVTRVAVVNNSAYAYDIDVAGAKADGWMLIGTAAEQGNTDFADVFDQGDSWTFRFSTQGRIVGEIERNRADLERAGWRVVIPGQFADALRTEGVVPTAPTRATGR